MVGEFDAELEPSVASCQVLHASSFSGLVKATAVQHTWSASVGRKPHATPICCHSAHHSVATKLQLSHKPVMSVFVNCNSP